jgi:hypothetical protein
MKISKLLMLGVMILCPFVVSSAFGVCEISDGIGTDKTTYVLNEKVVFTITMSASGCDGDVTNVSLYFFKPDNPPPSGIPCIDPTQGTLIASGLTLVNGAPALVFKGGTGMGEYPDLLWTVTPADVAAGYVRGYYGFLFTKPGQLESCDSDNISADVTPPLPCLKITKEVDCKVSKETDTVIYDICIENCGPTAIGYLVGGDTPGIEDTLLGDLSKDFLDGCPDIYYDELLELAVIPAGYRCCLPFKYTIPDGAYTGPGTIMKNTVTFVGIDEYETRVGPISASADVTLVEPKLKVEKSCVKEPIEYDPDLGGFADFKITVENIGDVCLDVVVKDLDVALTCLFPALAPAEVRSCPVTIDVPPGYPLPTVLNRIEGFWTICYPPATRDPVCLDNEGGPLPAQDDCDVPGGATRTPGFWKTHTKLTDFVLQKFVFTGCGTPDGLPGCIDLGFIKVCSIEEFCALMWANKSKNSDGSKRDALCQARMHALFHALAAIINNCVPGGAPMPSTPTEIRDILGGTDIAKIKALASKLAAYNESGDGETLIIPGAPMGSATPQDCKGVLENPKLASYADCLNGITSTGKGKGNNK